MPDPIPPVGTAPPAGYQAGVDIVPLFQPPRPAQGGDQYGGTLSPHAVIDRTYDNIISQYETRLATQPPPQPTATTTTTTTTRTLEDEVQSLERRLNGGNVPTGKQQQGQQGNGRNFFSFPNLVQGISGPLAAASMSLTPELVRYTEQVATYHSRLAQGLKATAPNIPKALATATRWQRLGLFARGSFGRLLTFGRWAPGLSCGIAAFDIGRDWYRYFTSNPSQHQPFSQERRDAEAQVAQLRTGAIVNTACTALGAVIGGFCGGGVFSVPFAMIGAGIGNLVGNLAKSLFSGAEGIAGSIGKFLFG